MSEPSAERDLKLVELLDQALSELRAGKAVETVTWQGRDSDLDEDLPALLETMRDLDAAAATWRGGATVLDPARLPAPLPDNEPLPATIGRYRIQGLLGAGGMGKVYRAHDPELNRAVAIKVPRIDGGGRAARVARFLREARAAARVRHPHVCPIHDVGEEGGLPYVVMAHVEGESLAQRLERLGRYEDPRDAVALVRQVAAALQAVHDEGIVHRDLKPGNILLDTSGAAFLSDFGLARSVDSGEALTADGDLLGTPAYMPPEQAQGRADAVGPRADLYSLGVVLYQMLTGRLPHEGPTTLSLLHRISTEEPSPASRFRPDLDPALEGVVKRAMARRPEDRHASPKDFAAELGAWLHGATQTAPVAPAPGAPEMKTVELSGLPGGETLKLSLPAGSKADVKVRMAGGGKRKKASWAVTVSISVAVAALLLAAWLPFYLDSRRGDPGAHIAQVASQPPKELPPAKGGDKDLFPPKGADKDFPPAKGVDKKVDGPTLLAKDAPVLLASAATLRPREPRTRQTPPQGLHAVSWSDDGTQVVSASPDGTVTVLDARSGKEVKRLRGQQAAAYFLQQVRDGRGVGGAVDADSYHLAQGYLEKGIRPVAGPEGEEAYLAYSPVMNHLAAVQRKKVEIRDLESGKSLTWPVGEGPAFKVAALSPDGKRLVAGGEGGEVKVWDVAAGKPLLALQAHLTRVRALVFSPDGKGLASAGDDRRVKLWDAATGKALEDAIGLPASVLSLAFSPDGKLLACGDSAGMVRVWSLRPWRLVAQTPPPKGDVPEAVPSLAFSPDGKHILIGGAEGSATVVTMPGGGN